MREPTVFVVVVAVSGSGRSRLGKAKKYLGRAYHAACSTKAHVAHTLWQRKNTSHEWQLALVQVRALEPASQCCACVAYVCVPVGRERGLGKWNCTIVENSTNGTDFTTLHMQSQSMQSRNNICPSGCSSPAGRGELCVWPSLCVVFLFCYF